MSDRFKFRMFDKNISKMWNFDNDCMLETVFECLKQQLAFDSGLEIFKPIAYDHISDGRIFMQCTGLKDKNCKLIYDGDILKHPQLPHKVVCEWYKDGFWLSGFMYGAKRELRNMHSWYEVIGNIYENTDLLEG